METPSAAQLIEKYIECRNSIAEIEKQTLPYRQGMELIENLLAAEINRLEGQAIKTEKGTAFRSMITSFKVADRDAWMRWVIRNKKLDMFTNNVSKEAIKEYMDGNGGNVPPGLNMSQAYRINVRSPVE